MTYEVKDLFEMVQRIERRIGIVYSTSMSTVTGEIHHLRENILIPRIEIDIPVSGDNFEVSFPPVLLGDGYAIGGHVTISMHDTENDCVVIHKWRDVTFNGIVGTIKGAEGAYDGKLLAISYYHKDVVFFKISIASGEMRATQVIQPTEDIIINDEITKVSYLLQVTEHGYIDLVEIDSSENKNTKMTDEVSGKEYQLSLIDGYLSYEEV